MATYYWVDGSGNWDATTTTNWATSSGGTGGAGVPTSADDVIFDANSNTGTGAFTVTVTGTSAAPAVCNDFSTGGAGGALDGAMTLSQGATSVLDIYGSLTLPATNFTWSGTSGNQIRFRATTTGKTVTTNGVSIGGGTNTNFDFNGIGGGWTLGSALTTSGNVVVSAGTFNTGNFNVTAIQFNSQFSNSVKASNFGSSTITLSSVNAFFLGGANLSFNAGTSSIVCTAGTASFGGFGQTFYNVSFTSTSGGVATITGANTFNDLTFTTTSATGIRRVSIGANQTINGTLTLGAANTAIRRVQLFSDVVGTARTVTVNGTLATLADVDFRDITAAGTVATPWTGTRLGNGGNVTNITTDTPKTVYRVGTGNWSATQWATSSGGSVDVNNLPLAQDTAIFDTGTVTGTHTIDLNWWIGNFDCSALNVAVTLSTGQSPVIHGNCTLDADITLTGAGQFVFSGASNQTIISAGRTITQQPIVIKPTTTSLLLGDALTTSVGFFLTQGTLDLNGYDLTCLTFSSSNSNTRSIVFGSKAINVTGNNAVVWFTQLISGFSYTGTPTINLTYSGSTGTRTISSHTTTSTPSAESVALNFNVTAGTDTVATSVITFSTRVNNLNFTGFSGTINLANGLDCFGNLTIPSTATVTGGTTAVSFLKSSGSQTVTTNGKTIDNPVTKNEAGTLALGDSLTIGSTRTLTLTQGTISLGAFNLTTGLYSSTGSSTRQLNVGTGTFTNSGATFTVSGTNFSTAGTGTISMTSGSSKTFAGGSFSYPTLNQGGAGELIITGTNTFARLSNSVNGTTITFPNVTTNVADWKVNGVVGSVTTIQRTGASGTFTLNYTGTGRVEADYLSISNSTVTPSNTWFAGTRSTDGGGNTGWSFTFTTGTRYWVGGSGNWDASTTTNWAVASGGTGGVPAPTATDSVIFDANSNSGTSAFTVTVTGTTGTPALCNDFSTGGYWGALDGAMTLTMGATAFLDIYGSMTLPATNFSVSGTSGATLTFKSTTTGKTITTNGVSLSNVLLIFNGVGGEWTLGSAYTSTNAINLTAGSFLTNNFNVTGNSFIAANSAFVRSANFGSSTFTFNGSTPISIAGVTNLTINAGTSTISCSNAAPTFAGSGLTYYNVSFTSTGSGTTQIQGANTFNDLTVASRAATGFKSLQLSANQTVNGTLTLGTANTAIRRIWVASTVIGTPRIISAATVAALSDVDFRDITGAGTGVWSGTRLGDGVGNSGITFDAPKTVYWNLVAGGNWSATAWATTSGGTPDVNNFPLAQDTAIIENTGLNTSATITLDQIWQLGKLDFSTRSNAMTFANGANLAIIYGDVLLSSAVTLTGTAGYAFLSKGTQNLDFAGVTLPQAFSVFNNSTTTKLLSALTSTSSATLNSGTLDLNGYDLTCGVFSSSNSNTRSIAFGSKKIIVTGNAQTVIEIRELGNFTFTGTPTFDLTYSGSTGTRTIRYGTTSGGTELKSINLNITSGTDTIEPGNSYVLNLNFTGFSGILTNISPGNCTIYGNTTISSGMTIASTTAGYTFAKSSGTQTLVSAGKTFDCPITKTAEGTLALGGALTMGTTRTFTLTQGTLDLNGYDLSCGVFAGGNSNVRSIAFGTNKVIITGNNTTVVGFSPSTNFTYTGSGQFECTYSGSTGTRQFAAATGVTESNAVNIKITAGTDAVQTFSAHSFNNLDFTGFSGTLVNNARNIYGNLTLSSGMTLSAGANATTFLKSSGTQTLTSAGKTIDFPITKEAAGTLALGDALTIGSTLTFTLTQGTLNLNGFDLSCGVFSSDNSNTRSINFGAKRIYVADTRESGTQIIAMPTMTNFNYTGSGIFNVNNSGSGTKRCSTGTTAGGTESNAISIECAAGTGILKTFGHFKDINLTGYSGQYDLQEIGGTLNKFIYGDMTISSTTTVLGGSTNNLTFQKSSGTQTLTSAGKTFDCPVGKSAAGTLQLSDNLTMGSTRTFTLTQGTLNLDGKTLSTGSFSSSNSNARTINLGTNGKITVTGSGTAWNTATATNLTELGTGIIDMTSASAKTFAGGSSVYPYTLNQGGSGTLTITGANSFADITATVRPSTITFPASTTTTVKDFSVSGTLGNLVTLNSSTPGTRWTLFATGLVSCSYVSISDSNGTPPFLDYGEGSVDAGNNVGWVFALRSSITEAVTNTDSENFDLYIFRDISEDSGLADVNQSQGDFNSEAIELVEMLGAEESVSAIFNSDISENAVVDDIALGPAVFNSSLTEPLTSNETQDRILVISRSITENSTPADVEDRTLTIYRDIVQNLVSGANEGNTNNVFNPSILENSTVVDIATGRGWFKINDAQNPNWVDVDDNQ